MILFAIFNQKSTILGFMNCIFFNFILYKHLKNTKILSDIKHHEVKIYVFNTQAQ